MIIRLFFSILIAAGSSFSLFAQEKTREVSQQVLVHTRGQSDPIVESWMEDGVVYFRDLERGKSYSGKAAGLTEYRLASPRLDPNWKGVLKYRRQAWWFLQFQRGSLPEDMVSDLYRYDQDEKRWKLIHKLDMQVSNFEMLQDNHFLIFGVYSPEKNRYYVAGKLSSTGSVSPIEGIPFLNFADMFWKSCVTSIDEEMAYAYFPFPGLLYGYDLKDHVLRHFKTPWPQMSESSINKEIESSKDKNYAIISAAGHPGAAHCYFVPAGGDKMLFVYKIIDDEQEKRLAFPDGRRPVVEKVASFLMFPSDPGQIMEWSTPSQSIFDRWCWNQVAGKLVRWEDFKAPAKVRSR